VAWQLNGNWLESIPVLHRMPPKFLARVALNMSMAVYAPKEKPPAQRLYVISKGFCTYGGTTLKAGDHWGQRDMAATKYPLCATAITYLHVNYVATKTIFELADSFQDSTVLWELKKWMVFQKFREYVFNLVKLERKRAAWRAVKGEHAPFPDELWRPGDELETQESLEEKKLLERSGGKCFFWFLSASHLLESEETPLPSFQDLQKRGWLTEKEISHKESYQGIYASAHLAVSHRWFDPQAPDMDGMQLKEIRSHVRRNTDIKWVWFGAATPQPPCKYTLWML